MINQIKKNHNKNKKQKKKKIKLKKFKNNHNQNKLMKNKMLEYSVMNSIIKNQICVTIRKLQIVNKELIKNF